MNIISLTLRTIVASALMAMAVTAAAQADTQYFNPVLNKDFPDPTVVRAPNGYFYAFATGRTVQRYASKDLVHWTRQSDAFTESGRPQINSGSVWAPDINYFDNKHVLYYSQSVWGGEWSCGIGVATCDRATGTFTDQGKLFTSDEIGVQNSIDPFFIEDDDGSRWLFWGSFRGIYAIQLSDDGLALKEGAEKKRIAGSLTEGTYIYKRDGYYYLFGSAGTCCDGLNSTYRLVVARSKNLLGPYTAKNGTTALNNGFTEVLHKSSDVVGPGHCSEIIEDDLGRTWIMYHGYQAAAQDKGRCMFLDEVQWDSDGWPYIETERPSVAWDKPVFGTDPYTYSDVDYVDFRGESLNYTYLFDTGFVPKSSTRVEFDCYSYPQNELDEPFAGVWRAVFSGRDNVNNGMSLYVTPEADQWGFFMGGYVNNGLLCHEFETKYSISAKLSQISINGEEVKTNRSAFAGGKQRITLFSGTDDYPYFGRIYGFKIFNGSKLMCDFVPKLRNEDGMVMFYDKVNDHYIRPSSSTGFGYGEIVDGIATVSAAPSADAIFDLQGRRLESAPQQGIYIQNNKKIMVR